MRQVPRLRPVFQAWVGDLITDLFKLIDSLLVAKAGQHSIDPAIIHQKANEIEEAMQRNSQPAATEPAASAAEGAPAIITAPIAPQQQQQVLLQQPPLQQQQRQTQASPPADAGATDSATSVSWAEFEDYLLDSLFNSVPSAAMDTRLRG